MWYRLTLFGINFPKKFPKNVEAIFSLCFFTRNKDHKWYSRQEVHCLFHMVLKLVSFNVFTKNASRKQNRWRKLNHGDLFNHQKLNYFIKNQTHCYVWVEWSSDLRTVGSSMSPPPGDLPLKYSFFLLSNLSNLLKFLEQWKGWSEKEHQCKNLEIIFEFF